MKYRPAKFSVPPQRGLVERPRLLRWMAERPTHATIWIGGPPGAGKTTLAAAYVTTLAEPVLWYRVNSEDNDPAEFFSSLREAVGLAVRGDVRLPQFTADDAAHPASFARRFVTALAGRLDDRCTIVLDDLHELHRDVAYDSVSAMLAAAPAGLRIVLVSRAEPPDAFDPYVAAGALDVLDPSALDFTLDEMRALLPEQGDTALKAIYQLTRGWPAGIILAARCWPRDIEASGLHDARTASKEAIFDFFAQEILSAMPEDDQRLLQVVSLLDEVRSDDARALTASPRTEQLLTSMARRNLFTTYRRGEPDSFELHALFRAFLVETATRRMPASALRAYRVAAARLCLARDAFAKAMVLFAAADHWDEAEEALLAAAPRLLHEGRHATLRRWLERLPAARLADNPRLLFVQGQVIAHDDEFIAGENYARAYDRFVARGADALGQARCAAAALIAIQAAESSYRDLALWSDRLDAAVVELPRPLASADEVAITAATLIGWIAGVATAKQATLDEWVDRLLRVIESDRPRLAPLLIATADVLLVYCQHRRAVSLFERLNALVADSLDNERIGALARARWLIQTAACQLNFSVAPDSAHSLAPATEAFDRACAIVERHELHVLRFDLLRLESLFAFVAHDEARYAALVLAAEAHIDLRRPSLFQQYCGDLCCLLLRQGDKAKALEVAERGEAAARIAATPALFRYLLGLAHAGALIASERLPEAVALCEQLELLLTGREKAGVSAYIALADAWERRHASDYAPALRTAMRQVAAAGWTHFWMEIPDYAASVCRDALLHDIEPEFVRICIEKRRLKPPADTSSLWPWKVRIRVLGRFSVEVNDVAVEFGPKVPRRQVRLLQAIAMGGTVGIETSRALDWLGSGKAATRNAFDVTLHRLRKLLCVSDAIVTRDGRAFFDPQLVWTDVAELDALMSSLAAMDVAGADTNRLTRESERLMALYQGQLLPDETSAWATVVRDQLQVRFERTVRVLARECERREEWPLALRLYDRALEADALSEELYRGQIRCFLAQGRPDEATSAYQRCRQLLSVVLGVPPAPQTDALIADVAASR